MKTIQELYEKIWYIAIKAIYILSIIWIIIFWIYWFFEWWYEFDTQWWCVLTIFIFEIIRRAFYYIVLWNLFPTKN